MDITPNAIEVLKKMLEQENASGKGIRINIIPGCCTPRPQMLIAEKAEDNDKIFSVDGIHFFIDKSTEQTLSGYIIDHNTNGFKLDYMLPQGRCCR